MTHYNKQMLHTIDAYLQADLQRCLWEETPGSPEDADDITFWTARGEFGGGGATWHIPEDAANAVLSTKEHQMNEPTRQADWYIKKEMCKLMGIAGDKSEVGKTRMEDYPEAWRIYDIWKQGIPFEFEINGHGDQVWKIEDFILDVNRSGGPCWKIDWVKEEMAECEITEEYHPRSEMYYSDYGNGIWICKEIIDGLTSPGH